MRARNKIIIIIIIVVGYSFLPLDQSKPMSVSTEHCFSSNDTWGPVDRCIAETRLNEVLSANSLYWAIGGIIFVLVTVWLMLDRFSSKLKGKNLNNNTEQKNQDELQDLRGRINELEKDKHESKPKNDSDETIKELENKIREIHNIKKIDSFKPVKIITISALCAAGAFAVILILNPFGGGFDDVQNNFDRILYSWRIVC